MDVLTDRAEVTYAGIGSVDDLDDVATGMGNESSVVTIFTGRPGQLVLDSFSTSRYDGNRSRSTSLARASSALRSKSEDGRTELVPNGFPSSVSSVLTLH